MGPPITSTSARPSDVPTSSEPSLAPTQDRYKFDIIWLPDASTSYCDGATVSGPDDACQGWFDAVEFLQQTSAELMMDYNDMTFIPYDAEGRIEFDAHLDSVDEYVEAIP